MNILFPETFSSEDRKPSEIFTLLHVEVRPSGSTCGQNTRQKREEPYLLVTSHPKEGRAGKLSTTLLTVEVKWVYVGSCLIA